MAGGAVRPFESRDLEQVADLHRRVFNLADQMSEPLLSSYRSYLTRIFLESPWPGSPPRSLVYEEQDKVIGFLGAVPRALRFNGKPIVAAVSSQFVVEPSRRGLVGLQLAKTFLSGNGDLALADESNDDSRMLLQRLGFATIFVESIHWFFPLRPFEFARRFGRKPGAVKLLLSVATPADAILARTVPPFRRQTPALASEELDTRSFLDWVSARRAALVPDHNEASARWYLERAAQLKQHGELQRVLVKTPKNTVAGCYVYYLHRQDLSHVVYFSALPDMAEAVLNHLMYHAWSGGAIAVAGRIVPECCHAFAQAQCVLNRYGKWMVAYSRNPEIVAALHRGDSHLSRLDGEWLCHFNHTDPSG
jgi:hypothetical protein